MTADKPKRFAAVRKWKDGGEQIWEFFFTQSDALEWIVKQPKPRGDEFIWCVGEFE